MKDRVVNNMKGIIVGQDLLEGPFWENGYFTVQDKPGYGIELNPDVAKAHLAPGETWWG